VTTTVVRPFSDAYLLTYSAEHVAYEVDMFFNLAGMLSQPSRKVVANSVDQARIINNSLVEAFGIHVRNVVDFLYIDNPRPSDVVATDFFSQGQWQALRPVITQNLENARTRANKELAHLTTDRISGTNPTKDWAFADLANEVRTIVQLFARNAQSSALSANVAMAIR
jgi:hypothetical protein